MSNITAITLQAIREEIEAPMRERIALLEAALLAIKKSKNWLEAWSIADEAIKKVGA